MAIQFHHAISTLADLEKSLERMKECLPKGTTPAEVYFDVADLSASVQLFTVTLSDGSKVFNFRITG